MTTIYKIPEEAIAACDAQFEKSWMEFSTSNHIKPEVNQQAYDITKKVFYAGYVNGVKFVGQDIIKIIEKSKETRKI